MRVLIAINDKATGFIVQSMLIKWGYSVTIAHDGEEAWSILDMSELPLLVVLDWELHRIEGLEIVRRLRAKGSSNPHYIIVTTSINSEVSAAQALDHGADDFIVKPFNINELRARIAVGFRVKCLQQALTDKIRMLEAATETITRLARTDDLTGLHNRRSFHEIFTLSQNAAKRHNHPLSLIIIDLDHFKSVNDYFGHSTGDRVLHEFAALLLEMAREEDVVSRWGGEEFIILLPHADCTAAVALAERIRKSIRHLTGKTIPRDLTASFGVAQLEEGETEDALIKRADDALYRAKKGGRNQVAVGLAIEDFPAERG